MCVKDLNFTQHRKRNYLITFALVAAGVSAAFLSSMERRPLADAEDTRNKSTCFRFVDFRNATETQAANICTYTHIHISVHLRIHMYMHMHTHMSVIDLHIHVYMHPSRSFIRSFFSICISLSFDLGPPRLRRERKHVFSVHWKHAPPPLHPHGHTIRSQNIRTFVPQI